MTITFVSHKPLDSVVVSSTVRAAVAVIATVNGVNATDTNDDGSAERTVPPLGSLKSVPNTKHYFRKNVK